MVLEIVYFICLLIFVSFQDTIAKGGFVPPSKPDYTELEKWSSSPLSEDPLFIKALGEYAGYYKDPTKRPSLAKTVVIAGVNNGYKDFFHNFKCYMDRLGIKFFPVSLDEGIYSYLTSNQVCNKHPDHIVFSICLPSNCQEIRGH